jgi:hypothetical protein
VSLPLKPSDLSVQTPTGYEAAITLKTARSSASRAAGATQQKAWPQNLAQTSKGFFGSFWKCRVRIAKGQHRNSTETAFDSKYQSTKRGSLRGPVVCGERVGRWRSALGLQVSLDRRLPVQYNSFVEGFLSARTRAGAVPVLRLGIRVWNRSYRGSICSAVSVTTL